jgi:hypothetical protein
MPRDKPVYGFLYTSLTLIKPQFLSLAIWWFLTPRPSPMDAYLSVAQRLQDLRPCSQHQLLYFAHIAYRHTCGGGNFGSDIHLVSFRQFCRTLLLTSSSLV